MTLSRRDFMVAMGLSGAGAALMSTGCSAIGNTITRILVRWPTEAELGFDPNAVYEAHHESLQGYVFHCHILDHEDNEMMRPMHIEGQ